MAPKTKITREAIIEGALEIVRKEGIGKLNARNLASFLNISTQPVLYHFSTMEELKKAVFKRADEFHSAYIFSSVKNSDDPFLSLGLGYVKFAHEERNLFVFLFQENNYKGSFMSLFEDDGLLPILRVMEGGEIDDEEAAKNAFLPRFLMVHGLASLVANNGFMYDEDEFRRIIKKKGE